MNCWYIYGEDCERHGICEGCQKYEDWRKQRDELLMNDLKKKAKEI